jgi:hypothetical protein
MQEHLKLPWIFSSFKPKFSYFIYNTKRPFSQGGTGAFPRLEKELAFWAALGYNSGG